MRTAGLHAGVVITPGTQRPKGTDATMAWTKNDGWVRVFALLDHHTDEAWAHVAKIGNRFAALQPVYDAVADRLGTLDPDIARGIKLRHNWGSQYRSGHFQGSLPWLGIEDDAAFVGEPQGSNACRPGSLPTSTISGKGSPPTSTSTTTSGSSSIWATAHHDRRFEMQQRLKPRNCPTNRDRNTAWLPGEGSPGPRCST